MKRKILLVTSVAFALAQLVPVDRENPPITAEVPASPEMRELLKRSCYDCHSHEARWPWYAYVAPVSWLVAYDVSEAREHMNFSTWDIYDEEEQSEKLEEAWEEVEEGEMPLWYYLALHPDARLTESDERMLRAWAGEHD